MKKQVQNELLNVLLMKTIESRKHSKSVVTIVHLVIELCMKGCIYFVNHEEGKFPTRYINFLIEVNIYKFAMSHSDCKFCSNGAEARK